MTRSLAYIVPTYQTADTLPLLIDRIDATAPQIAERHEIIVVDDACPKRSGALVAGRPRVRVFGFDCNQGQRTAVLTGMSLADAEVVCVLDADLQDDPADVAKLVGELDRSGTDVVCAGRRGTHQPISRRVQARMFRRIRWLAVRGAVPADAGLFHVARDSAVRAMLAAATPESDPLVCYAHTGSHIESVPIRRQRRPSGRSAYSLTRRWAMARTSMRSPRGYAPRDAWPTPHEITGGEPPSDRKHDCTEET